ncbi:MAG: Smr/MutS family protein [Azospirillaceae bacterium]|nr:Smr/MutS family protein [Azospirillaceae bacterium]
MSAEESALWQRVVRDAVPLHPVDQPAVPPVTAPAAAPAIASTPDPAVSPRLSAGPARVGIVAGPLPPAPVGVPALAPLSPEAAPGLDRQTDRRLRRGLMAIDGRLDLHGLTQAEAHSAIVGFIERGWREDRRCLLVITGKGAGGPDGGILRQAVPRWLNEPSLRRIIVGLHRAQARHGGDGALYVLLKRRRDAP